MRIAWVHPTWRDLVINAISRDDRARRRFLRHCGVHGAVLALSTAGGDAGERELPLLRADQDWDTLGDRLYELAPELEPAELLAVLSALGHALRALRREPAGAAETSGLARIVLERVAQAWERARAPVEPILLEGWLELSRLLTSPPQPPAAALAITWAELVPVSPIEPEDRAEVRRLTDWLGLCAALVRFDPELPAQLGLGRAQRGLLRSFVAEIEAGWPGTTGDHVLPAIAAISRMVPDLATPELRGAAFRLEDRLRLELRPSESVLVPGVGWRSEPDPVPHYEFDVARVLSDL